LVAQRINGEEDATTSLKLLMKDILNLDYVEEPEVVIEASPEETVERGGRGAKKHLMIRLLSSKRENKKRSCGLRNGERHERNGKRKPWRECKPKRLQRFFLHCPLLLHLIVYLAFYVHYAGGTTGAIQN